MKEKNTVKLKLAEVINSLKDSLSMTNKIKAAVLGCTGYTGLELVNILIKHPNVTLSFLGSQSHSGDFINKHDKRFKNVSLPQLESLENINFSKFDVVFFALPHNVSQKIIKNNFGKTIFIDLSADFRLEDPIIYKENYDIEHQCPSLLKEFVYGLPEIILKILKIQKILQFLDVIQLQCFYL